MTNSPAFKEFFDEPSMAHWGYGSISHTLARIAADYDTLLDFHKTDCHISLTSNLNKPNEYVFSIVAFHNGDYSNYEEMTGCLQYAPSKDDDLLKFVERAAERGGLTKFAKGISNIRDELEINKDTVKQESSKPSVDIDR